PKTKTFAEVMLVTTMTQTQKKSAPKRDEKALLGVVLKVRDAPAMVRGLQYFLERVVSRTDAVGSKSEREIVRWGCGVAGDAIVGLSTTTAALDE
ncbi:hypothetical protein LTS18_014732, partial [Coniosporium uncinatum]